MARSNQSGRERLQRALTELGVSGGEPTHHRSNPLHAIELFALAKQDESLEKAARAQIDAIKKANATEH